MTRGMLLDTNLIIQAFDDHGTSSAETREAAKQRMNQLLSDPDVSLAINPLILYEVLRGIPQADADRIHALSTTLRQFETYEIRSAEADLAAQLWRYATEQGQKPDRRSFDLVHIASAYENSLEMTSADGDMAKLQKLYEKMKDEKNA